MLIVCIVPDQKNSVQNYAVANVKAYFLYRRFTIKTEFNFTHTRIEYQIRKRTAQSS